MDAGLLEFLDFFKSQWLNKLPVVNELIRRVRFLYRQMMSGVVRGMNTDLPTNFVHCWGRQTLEFLFVYFIGKTIGFSDEFVGRERAHSSQ